MITNRNVVAIGTSAGGVEALLALSRQLPASLSACVLVTIHLDPDGDSILDELLTKSGAMKAAFASDGDDLRPGRILIAPPDRHLIIEKDVARLGRGPRENNARPAVDPFFRSVALCCGGRAIGVVLTGMLGDGAAGLSTLDRRGALTVVQDPADAMFSSMPSTALRRVEPTKVARLAEIPRLLERMVREPAAETPPEPSDLVYEVDMARGRRGDMSAMDKIGHRSVFTCPDCHGALWEIAEADSTRYRCHVGHAYSNDSLGLALDENLRRALESAERALEERAEIGRKLAREAEQQGRPRSAAVWHTRIKETVRELDSLSSAVRRIDDLRRQQPPPPETDPAPEGDRRFVRERRPPTRSVT